MWRINKLKIQLVQAAACVMLAAFALCAATYAWYVANNTVSAKTSTISATTNGFILQIATLDEGAQHGGNDKSLAAFSDGATLSPASSNDLSDWYICQGWNNQGLITSYVQPIFETGPNAKPGNYKVGNDDYYAFIRSDYIVYTINETGLADVYLDASDGAPIAVTAKNADGTVGSASETITGSMRVAITTQEVGSDGKSATGPESLRVVYANNDETGQGNDAQGKNGWTAIWKRDGGAVLDYASYRHIFGGNYIDVTLDSNGAKTFGKNWVATKDGDAYKVPDNSEAVAARVGYDGIVVHVYIWMEGTDSDCVNGKSIENDPCTYDVTVKLAGIAAA